VDLARGQAAAWTNLGHSLELQGRTSEAQRVYELALHALRGLTRLPGGPTEQGIELLALVHNNLGSLLHAGADDRGAQSQFSAGIEALSAATAEHAQRPETRLLHASLECNVAISCAALGDRPRAQAAHAKALAELESLHADFPRIHDVALELANALRESALFHESGNTQQARELFRRAIDLYADSAAGSAPDPLAILGQSICWERLSQLGLAQDDRTSAAALERARELASGLVRSEPQEPEFSSQLAVVLHSSADRLSGKKEFAAALKLLREAVRLETAAHQARPLDVAFTRQLVRHYRQMAEMLLELGEFNEAVAAGQEILALSTIEPAAALDAARLLARCVSLSANIRSKVPLMVGEEPLAEYCVRHSLTALQMALAGGVVDREQLSADPSLDALLGRPEFQRLIAQPGDLEEASEGPVEGSSR
jgi:tetratricopeptide (TPR) repeat protein